MLSGPSLPLDEVVGDCLQSLSALSSDFLGAGVEYFFDLVLFVIVDQVWGWGWWFCWLGNEGGVKGVSSFSLKRGWIFQCGGSFSL